MLSPRVLDKAADSEGAGAVGIVTVVIECTEDTGDCELMPDSITS
jgi:hypothetical protein